MRKPIAIGFYPDNKGDLGKQVAGFLQSEKKIKALGLVAPHAGYQFSGDVAGATFSSVITKSKNFVIFCPNHTGHGSTIALSNEDWQTPLGIVKINKDIVRELSRDIEIDENAHMYEHSVEVQLPFLQMLYNKFTIVPLCLGHLTYIDIEKLADVFINNCKDSFFIASSDFIHFGSMYGYIPVTGNIEQQLRWVKDKDIEMVNMICKLDAKKFYETVTENHYSVCGFIPITLLLLIIKKLGAKNGTLIKYKTSYAVQPSSSFVSYVGIVFE